MPFDGLRVLSLESRRAKEMEALIRREGGDPFVAPSVQERALEDNSDAIRFVERLEAGEFDMVVCMTGTGLTFLRDQVVAHLPAERLSAALAKATLVARGPKPLPILRELGLKAQIVIPEPNTWKEIVEAVAARPERRIAIQEYGRPNREMNRALEKLGARVSPIVLYRWDFPSDMEPLRSAARGLAQREFDGVLFTSSIQLDHLLAVAEDLGIRDQVCSSLKEWTAVASVGPVMTAWLEEAGFPVDIVPVHPKMGALVKAASDGVGQVIQKKRHVAEMG
ncbi:MAG: uroporphyrinogen-III synthase [Acidobacteriota bacterium]